ncbi:Structural maintenance of chromosomes protein 4, partial [Perkinsus chesapeaki]
FITLISMFWAEKIVPGKPLEISSESLEGATLELLNVVLSGSQKHAKLFVSTDGEDKFMIARLSDAQPNVQLGLDFEEDVVFTAEGGEITISGNIGLPEGMEEDESDIDDEEEDFDGPIPVAMESDVDEEEEEEEDDGKFEEITEEPIAGPKKAEKKPQQKSPAKKSEKKAEMKEVQKTIEKKEEPSKKQEQKKEQEAAVRTKTLPGGLKYEVIRAGHGGIPCPAGKTAKVKYAGRLAKNGKQFDKGTIDFRVGMGEVIKGWDMSVKGMQVGEVRKLFIPAHLAYGRGGAPPAIPPNSDLVFDVELLNIQGGKKRKGGRR